MTSIDPTMSPITPPTVDPTSALVARLSGGRPALQRAVSDALGIDGPPDPALSPIDAFHLNTTDTGAVCYLIAGGRLTRIETADDGRSLLVCLPLRRIRQVVESREVAAVTVAIEIDADVTAETTVSQSLTGPGDEAGTTQATRSEARSVTTPTSYTLTAPVSDRSGETAGELTRFARTLRQLL
jgi:hypothetical protein